MDEFGLPFDDPWKSISFSTQTIYQQTQKLGLLSCIFLAVVGVIASMTFFAEECNLGYYMETNLTGAENL